VRNPEYSRTFVFDNDYPALLEQPAETSASDCGLLTAQSAGGVCRVMCFSPRHDLTLALMPPKHIAPVVDEWRTQVHDLNQRRAIEYVQIFENKGALMGCSNPHPHCQIWATSWIPLESAREISAQSQWQQRAGKCLLCTYLQTEMEFGERTVAANAHFTALVPFWAVWPYELLIIANRHLTSVSELTDAEIDGLAEILSQAAIRYDNLFRCSFPYSMGIHQAPAKLSYSPALHLHLHFLPPLLRSATIRKFMVGFEMLGEPQRDITAETAAATLRGLPARHYLCSAASV